MENFLGDEFPLERKKYKVLNPRSHQKKKENVQLRVKVEEMTRSAEVVRSLQQDRIEELESTKHTVRRLEQDFVTKDKELVMSAETVAQLQHQIVEKDEELSTSTQMVAQLQDKVISLNPLKKKIDGFESGAARRRKSTTSSNKLAIAEPPLPPALPALEGKDFIIIEGRQTEHVMSGKQFKV